MKYGLFLRLLRALIHLKRLLWWVGAKAGVALGRLVYYSLRVFLYGKYRVLLLLKRAGFETFRERFGKRDVLQCLVLAGLFFISLPHTKLIPKVDPLLAGRKTIAYSLTGPEEESDVEEITATVGLEKPALPSWRTGVLDSQTLPSTGRIQFHDQDLSAVVAGGSAFTKPYILSGSTIGRPRDQMVSYVVEPGDSLGSIAVEFNVSIPTIIWENNLTLRSIIRPGDVLRIPPVTGIMHTVKKGDTLKKIATLYDAKAEDIISFNHLKIDGTDLIRGEQIVVPGGTKPQERTTTRNLATVKNLGQLARRIATPPISGAAPSGAGFVWPTASHLITQYFGWKHHAIDVAGPWQSPNYAAKAGVVEVSQCGWNHGYGCYVIIDHGGGVKTLYGHNSQLLVSPGEQVEAGQPIALMGNTGHVRGRTGIHLHFEVLINGVRVNPLGYVR